MKAQPNRNYVSSDDVQTPPELARQIVEHYQPTGSVLEPCCGDGNFYRAIKSFHRCDGLPHLNQLDWMEIKKGHNFLDATVVYDIPFDWIITNPPWSLFRPFLQRAMQLSTNVVFLVTVNHAWTKARVRDVKEVGFGLKEILLCEMPKTFPQSGFQLGAIHWQHGWKGDIKLSSLNKIHLFE